MTRIALYCLLLLGSVVMAGLIEVGFAGDAPRELGRVAWQNDLDAALAQSETTGRPVLILFQEIPGCSTCVDFGSTVLSHPLVVEAMETEFVPVAIHNNRPGRDAEILKRYGEPSWNYPVVRFVGTDGSDIIQRKDEVWSTRGIASRMIQTLKASDRPVPNYLRIVHEESSTSGLERATFAMHCYWEGEAKLGGMDGVISTQAGWLEGREVVELTFDPAVIAYDDLLRQAAKMQCASTVYARSKSQLDQAGEVVGDQAKRSDEPARTAKAGDQKYHLLHSELRYLPLTPMQAMKVNADLARGRDATTWLSPRQVRLAVEIAGAVRRDPDALQDLIRPERIEELAAYEATLRARLKSSGDVG